MPIQVEWMIPYRIIDERLSGRLGTEDLMQHSRFLVQMLSEALAVAPNRQVHLLLDMSDAQNVPPVYTMMKEAAPVLKMSNRGHLVLITRNAVIRNIVELTAHVMRFSMQACSSREEGEQILRIRVEEDERRALH